MSIRPRRIEPGASPGTLRTVASSGPPHIRAFSYGPDGIDEIEKGTVADVVALRGKRPMLWVDVAGLGDVDVLKELGTAFGLHNLALEDVLAVHHHAKVERFADHLFLVLRMPEVEDEGELTTDQLSIFMGEDYAITFQGSDGDCFDTLRTRIREGKGRLRKAGPTHLVHALLDSVIDSYYPVLEQVGEHLEELEEAVLDGPTRQLTKEIHGVRRDLFVLRRGVWPLREILNDLMRDDGTDPALVPFLRDCYDHVVELVDLIETYRDLAAGLMEVFVTIVGNRMNEIMKVLTMIATIFMPLSFVASVYGMNFDTGASPYSMPELGSPYGYVTVIAVMLAIATAMLVWFWRKGWLRGELLDRDAER